MNMAHLTAKLSAFASKLMGISSPASKLSGLTLDSGSVMSGENGFFETLFIMIKNGFNDILISIYEYLLNFVYAIMHWVLTMIDFIFIFIRQLVGMNTDFSSVESVTKSDLIFQFIFSDTVIKVIRGMIGFCLVLLILFCIFAIIKSEYDFMTQGGKDNSKKSIMVSTLKALFLMAFVPVVAIGSIIMSNAVLTALYNVTSGGTDVSIGSQIFLASTYQANSYRRYADRNLKIPITYNFEEITDRDNVFGYDGSGTMDEMQSVLNDFKNQDVWTRGWRTFLMFETDAFLSMTEVDRLDKEAAEKSESGKQNGSVYHAVYDRGILTRREQYSIMADVVEYTVKYNTPVYFKTAEEVCESFDSILQFARGNQKMIDQITGANSDVLVEGSKTIKNPIVKVNKPNNEEGYNYKFSAHYKGDDNPTEFTHIGGKLDEADGAVFIIAVERQVVDDAGKIHPYYYPLLSAKDEFATDYYEKTGQIVVARGLFEDGENPTAIREKDGKVEFYRDNIVVPALLDFFPKISYELPEGAVEHLGLQILKGAASAIIGVDVSQFIPYVYFNIDIFNLFTKKSYKIADIDGGQFKIDYNFTNRDIDKSNVYKFSDLNVFILVMASVLLIGILFKVLFGVVFRVFDILMLAITYPGVLATMPLDGGSRFKTWTETFVTKLTSIYSVVVGINIVLILAPLAWRIDLFTTTDIQKAFNLGEITSGFTADFVNLIVHFLFLLVALSSIQTTIKYVGDIVAGKDKSSDDIIDQGDKVLKDAKNVIDVAGKVVSGTYFIEKGQEIVKMATDFAVPGKAIVGGVIGIGKGAYDKAKGIAGAVHDISDSKKLIKGAKGENKTGGSDGDTGEFKEADKNSETPTSDDKSSGTDEGKSPDAPTSGSTGGGTPPAGGAGGGSPDAGGEAAGGAAGGMGGIKGKLAAKGFKEAADAAPAGDIAGDGAKRDAKLLDKKGESEGADDSKEVKAEDDADKKGDTSKGADGSDDAGDKESGDAGGDGEADGESGETPDASGDEARLTGRTFNPDEIKSAEGEYDPTKKLSRKEKRALNKREKAKMKAQKKADKQRAKQEYLASTTKSERHARRLGKVLGVLGGIGASVAKGVGSLAMTAGKLAVGLTKTALKLGYRVTKASLQAIYDLGTGKDIFTTLGKFAGRTIKAGAMGVAGVTKSGFVAGKNVVKASAKTLAGVSGSMLAPLTMKKKSKNTN